MMCSLTQTIVTDYLTMDSVSVGMGERMETQVSDRNTCCMQSQGEDNTLREACTYRRTFGDSET